jgi:uncharacterized protein (TIGR02145 family)
LLSLNLKQKKMKKKTIYLPVFIICISLVLFFANCSSDDTTSTTPNKAPNAPTTPSPANAVTGVAKISLNWSCTDPDGDALTYDLYLGKTSSPTLYKAGIKDKSFVPSAMQTSTTYYWKVVAKDSKGASTSSDVWSFTTGSTLIYDILFNSSLTYGSFTDARDGKVYKTIKIGTQTWMAQNLAYNPHIYGSWYYNNDSVTYGIYGMLYDWGLAKLMAPTGWHLPTHAEMLTLISFLGGREAAYKKLKETGSIHWTNLNVIADNSSGFTALPAGSVLNTGSTFAGNGTAATFWSSDQATSSNAYSLSFGDDSWGLDSLYSPPQTCGCSVRCIKD